MPTSSAWDRPRAEALAHLAEVQTAYDRLREGEAAGLDGRTRLHRRNSLHFRFEFRERLRANVPAGGTDPVSGATFFGANATDGACATPYFSSVYHHCDFGDGQIQAVYNNPANPVPGSSNIDTWFVRSHVTVPEPAAFALFGLGVVALGLRRRG